MIIIFFYFLRQWIFDPDAFDINHQHNLFPSSLITGTSSILVEKMRDHVLTYTKNPGYIESTSKRPTIIYFISKIKKRSLQNHDDTENIDCDSSGILTGIGEILVAKQEEPISEISSLNRELEEEASQ